MKIVLVVLVNKKWVVHYSDFLRMYTAYGQIMPRGPCVCLP